jgi:SAM-dependent methyltransferase
MVTSVWDLKASLYDKYVTKTKNRVLREFLQKEEKLLDEILLDTISNQSQVSLIEVGAGTGRTLFSYLTKRHILKKLAYLIGIDNAGAMYGRMKSKFEDIQDSGIVSLEDSEKFIFFLMDAIEMSRFFFRGKINVLELKAVYGENSYLQKLKPSRYNDSKKVVINLLNTLGVMKPDIRPKVLANMVLAAGENGKVVVSVFSSDCFMEIAPTLYGSLKRITGNFDERAFDPEKKEFRTRTYYSHWFSQNEIADMLERAGANDVKVTPINTTLKGFLVCGKT